MDVIQETCQRCDNYKIDDYPICTFLQAWKWMRKDVDVKVDYDDTYHPPCKTLEQCPQGRWKRTPDGYPIKHNQTQLPLW